MYSLLERLLKVTEAVATVDLQKEMKAAFKGRSTKLKLTTWQGGAEINRYKFWLLTDGTIIPVPHSHRDTVEDNVEGSNRTYNRSYWEDDARIEFLDTGAVAGYFDHVADEMGIEAEKRLTTKQISALKNLYLEHKPSTIYSGEEAGGQPIKSVKELDYFLNYGPMDEAKSEEDEKEQFFVERTEKHIGLVQVAAAKILDAYPEYDTEMLRDQIEVHDASKLEEPERTPYIEITWRHKLENEKGEFDPLKGKGYQTPGKLEKEDENEACLHHVSTNSHHPEHHVREEDRSDDADADECVDAYLMPPSDIAEMVADWQAMSEELQTNTSREWFEKQKDVRWHFTEEQEEQIDKLLKVFEEE